MEVSVRGKGFVVMACAAAVMLLGTVSSASAIDFSVGGVGFFASDFGGQGTHVSDHTTSAGKWVTREYTTPWVGGGFGVFFDATYGEAGIGITFAGGNPKVWMEDKDNEDDTSYTNKNTSYSMTFLNISVLGKYPISLSESASLYPAFGIDYHICVAGETEATINGDTHTSKWDGKDNNQDAGDNSHLWLKFGAGLDYGLSEKLFLRAQALYGVGFASKSTDDSVESQESGGANVKSVLGHGLTIKVGVGYKL